MASRGPWATVCPPLHQPFTGHNVILHPVYITLWKMAGKGVIILQALNNTEEPKTDTEKLCIYLYISSLSKYLFIGNQDPGCKIHSLGYLWNMFDYSLIYSSALLLILHYADQSTEQSLYKSPCCTTLVYTIYCGTLLRFAMVFDMMWYRQSRWSAE